MADLQALLDTGLKIVEPKVRLIAQTKIVDDDLLDQIWDEDYPSFTRRPIDDGPPWYPDGEYLIEYAGRLCYDSFHNPKGRTTGEYIENIIEHQHWSVLEHVHVTFDISGVSRSFTHDLVRHRHFNYSQLSQRFVDPKKMGVVVPPSFRGDAQLESAFASALLGLPENLSILGFWSKARVDSDSPKVHREAVRSLLPNAIETKIVVTGNLQAWRHFLWRRWNEAADVEIQEVAGMIASNLKTEYPTVFADVNYISYEG